MGASHEDRHSHTHGAAVRLEPGPRAVLDHGLGELLALTEGLAFRPTGSERWPLPLAAAVYGEAPAPERVRAEVAGLVGRDPVAALEPALVLLELWAGSRPELAGAVPDDAAFLSECFNSKRLNGWAAALGPGDAAGEVRRALSPRWKFRLFEAGGDGRLGLYALLNMLARYGFVYGRIAPGDSHELGHFVEEFTPGVVVCRGAPGDLELALSLAAMKLGVPAVVPPGYPFPLGRRAEADGEAELASAVVAFPNVRRLLDFPDMPRLPEWLDPARGKQDFPSTATWGLTAESFLVLRKGAAATAATGVEVVGRPAGAVSPLGVTLTVEGEPLDAFDRRYIESRAVRALAMLAGCRARLDEGRLVVELAAESAPTPERLGEALIAVIGHEFPKLRRVRAELCFDPARLPALAAQARAERAARSAEIDAATEESVAEFVTCVGCSPFAPDHVCLLTPERPPQCGRPYEMIKTGALYGFDDMTDIHHRAPHAGMNSFGTCPKGGCLDAAAGEWSGANAAAGRLTGGRTRRVQLHALDAAPHTGCGCFRLIMFRTELPRPGIAIMDRGYKGRAPDGRTWRDLHYALAGKQTPGMAGATAGYLASPKFLAAHGGWVGVVWASPKIAAAAGSRLPAGIEVGPEV